MKELTLKNKIYTIRNKQVMLDSDLAELYGILAFRLREQVKRNIERFPEEFMFKLNDYEVDFMVSQNAIPSKQHLGGHNPYVFTEYGVVMLSSVIKNKTATSINIKIIKLFVQMRKFLQSNAEIFQRLQTTEQKLLIHDNKIEEIFNLIQEKNIKPEKGIFYDGQIFDAHKFITDLISEAKESIILIDNYIDEDVLTLFSKTNLSTTIYTKHIDKNLSLALKNYNQQYNNIQIKEFNKSHDMLNNQRLLAS